MSAPLTSHQLQAYDAIFSANRTLTTVERIVLLAYSRHLGKQDWDVFPGSGTLAKMTGLSDRWVRETRKTLIERKLLVESGRHPRQRRRGNGRGKHRQSGTYSKCVTVMIENLQALSAEVQETEP
jgi:hypothetical protein